MYLYIRELNTPRIWVDIEENLLYDISPPPKDDNAMAHGSSSWSWSRTKEWSRMVFVELRYNPQG